MVYHNLTRTDSCMLTIDVGREVSTEHGASFTGLHVHHHLLVLALGVHALDGVVQFLSCQLHARDNYYLTTISLNCALCLPQQNM